MDPWDGGAIRAGRNPLSEGRKERKRMGKEEAKKIERKPASGRRCEMQQL